MMRLASIVASLGLGTAALLHALWLFSPWPLTSWKAWSHAFGGAGFRVPDAIMASVATLFAIAAYVVAARAAIVPRLGALWMYRLGCWIIATVFVLRSVIGFVQMRLSLNAPGMPDGFRETIAFYLAIYLPVFLVLGVLTGFVEIAASRRTARSSV